MTTPFQFPAANQAQIIRANQRDLYHIASLRGQTETLLQTWFGTRWLLRWDKELELCTKLSYSVLTTVHASQTLGEEYTDIWQQPSRSRAPPSRRTRSIFAVLSTLPPYILSRMIPRLNERFPNSRVIVWFRRLPPTLEVLSEINLAVFYYFGSYYDLAKRLFRIRHISSTPQNPNVSPPSYSLLGLMLSIRLVYRLAKSLRAVISSDAPATSKTAGKQLVRQVSDEPTVDQRPVSSVLAATSTEEQEAIPAEEDVHTLVNVSSLSADERAGRRCTLCLEERTSSCATECGHLFCWSCIMGWGREKPECPLCRQSLSLTRLLPIYNL